MVLGQGCTILVGIAIGLRFLAITRASSAFGVTATDPVTFASVIFLVTTALLACYIQAAAGSRSMVALRYR
jgi:hypothetical protein